MTVEENSAITTTEEGTTSKKICSNGLNSFECSLCQIIFNDRNALYRHRRREHVLETNVALGEFVIRVPLLSGHFRCPLACCDKRLKNVNTFKNYMDSCHAAEVQVVSYDNEQDQVQKKRKISPLFNFETGSCLTLASNEKTAYHQAMAIDCSPIAMHFKHHSLTSSISAHALMRKETILDVVGKLPFQDNCFSDSLECVLQLHNENGQGVQSSTEPSSARNHVYVEKFVASSRLPGLIDTFAFTEATTELIECLNLDFRISLSLLHAVAVLHTGCIIVDDYNLVFMLTAEVYSRSKLLDAHGETTLNLFLYSAIQLMMALQLESTKNLMEMQRKGN